MPCAFHLDRLKYNELDEGCQFPDAELIDFGGNHWCKFHLPLDAPQKAALDTGAFNKELFAFIDAAREKEIIADLSGIITPGNISFRHYAGEANSLPQLLFGNATFSGDVDFKKVTFSSFAYFRNATFCGRTEFSGATFSGADFRNATFSGTTYFGSATFCGRTEFSGATFCGHTEFYGATFRSEARFQEATFRNYVDFIKATFSFAYFENATFSQITNFCEATFRGADFRNATFSDYTDFSKATFGDYAIFSTFAEKPASGTSTDAQSSRHNCFFEISFRGASFDGRAHFTNRRFLNTTDFSDGYFKVAPEFHNCVLHQDTTFSARKFLDHSGRDETVHAYRTLKLAMEQIRARAEQGQFFRLEQLSLRHHRDTPVWQKIFSWIYGASADYGESAVRPLTGMLCIYIAFCVIYFTFLANLDETLAFAFKQIFQPFMVWRTNPPLPLGLALLGTLHSLFNIGFVTLFVVALRRRFSLK